MSRHLDKNALEKTVTIGLCLENLPSQTRLVPHGKKGQKPRHQKTALKKRFAASA
jgi:hypothetical protein